MKCGDVHQYRWGERDFVFRAFYYTQEQCILAYDFNEKGFSCCLLKRIEPHHVNKSCNQINGKRKKTEKSGET